jgi:hypothetical protein
MIEYTIVASEFERDLHSPHAIGNFQLSIGGGGETHIVLIRTDKFNEENVLLK